MKHCFKRTTSLLLVFAFIAVFVCSCNHDKTTENTLSLSGYKIIRPDGASTEETDVFSQFYSALCKNTGIDFEYGTDFIKEGTKYAEVENEILIGNTNRDESTAAKEEIGDNEYIIKQINTKIVIQAADDDALFLALYVFVHDVVSPEGTLPCALSLGGTYSPDKPTFIYSVGETDKPANPGTNPRSVINSINHNISYVAPRLTVQNITVFDPSDSDDYYYNMHPRIEYFNGHYIVVYSSGPINESDMGQRVMIAYSDDGVNWSEPKVLMDEQMGEKTPMVMYVTTVFAYSDRICVYIGGWEYIESSLQNNGTLRPPSEDLNDRHNLVSYRLTSFDGVNWGEPEKAVAFANILRTSSGRIIGTLGTSVMYTDDPTGVSGWSNVPMNIAAATAAGAKWLLEPSLYQTTDGAIYMMYRSQIDYLWGAVSYDNGESWSGIYSTEFADANSKAAFAVCPDGRILYAGNPIQGSARLPLSMAFSDDGVNFGDVFRLRYETDFRADKTGIEKGGYYQYPDILLTDDYIYVIYSVGKENIEISRISWDYINDLCDEVGN
ncbi:MAG: exo-alpha-sialidase [Eubacteriales bacterium]